jgi:hypothetical protein
LAYWGCLVEQEPHNEPVLYNIVLLTIQYQFWSTSPQSSPSAPASSPVLLIKGRHELQVIWGESNHGSTAFSGQSKPRRRYMEAEWNPRRIQAEDAQAEAYYRRGLSAMPAAQEQGRLIAP